MKIHFCGGNFEYNSKQNKTKGKPIKQKKQREWKGFKVQMKMISKNCKKNSSSKNTQRSTNTWFNVLKSWMDVRNYNQEVQKYQPVELNLILERFYAEVKKSDGKDYEPDCLRVMQSGIDR